MAGGNGPDVPEHGPDAFECAARPDASDLEAPRPCVHFVGFRGDEIHSARKIWGEADFYHRKWDKRALREIAPGDVVVHAKWDWRHPPSMFTVCDTVSCDEQQAYDS